MPEGGSQLPTRRSLIASTCAAVGVVGLARSPFAYARDYASPRELFDELDRLAALCGMRLGALGRERGSASTLVAKFLKALERYRGTREDFRRRFGLPKGVDPSSVTGDVDGDLGALRQSLDDLMIAYAEGLPALRDSSAVARLAVDMVDVSRLRTVVDLWAVAEGA
jgi:hypothetical protein